MFDVAAIGELLIDFTPSGLSQAGNELYEKNPGGAPANVLASLSKFGRSVAFLGMIGNDGFGKYLRETLMDAGINTSALKVTDKANTTLAFVHLNSNGDRSFSFYRNPGADMMISVEDLDYSIVTNSKIFHFGSVSMTHEPSRTATLHAVTAAKDNGALISYDPNFRAPLWDDKAFAKEVILKGMELADLVKISGEELLFLTGTNDLSEGSRILFKSYNIKLLFVTLGPEGCFYRFGDKTGCAPTYDVKTIDTTGAGDAFLAGVLYKLLEDKLDIEHISSSEMENIVDFANAVGSLATTKRGAIPSMPVISDVYSCICSVGKLL